MTNNNKKLTIVAITIAFVALVVTIPSYSRQEENNNPRLYDEIIRSNSILEETNIETGLYKSNNIYYFKGLVMNNYLEINGELWRIILIDEENNVTLIKEEGLNNNKTYKYNEEYNKHQYEDSIVKTKLIKYYNDNLSSINSIITKEYCINYENTCTQKEKTNIAIITPDILELNNISKTEYTEESYLINEYDYWVLNNKYDEIIDSAFSGYVSKLGNLDEGFVDEEKTIRPIITLSNNAQVTGEGTIDKPYILTE